MRRFELIFTFLQLPLDFALLLLAGISAFALRYAPFVTVVRPVLFNLAWNKFFTTLIITAFGWVVIYAFAGLYTTDPNRKLADDLLRVLTASSSGFAAITIFVFFTLSKFDSRFLVLAGWLIAMLYIILGRLLIRGLKSLLYRSGYGLRPTVIVGNNSITAIIQRTLESKSGLGCKVIAVFDRFGETEKNTILDLHPEEIIFTHARGSEPEAIGAINFANNHHITFKYSADLFETISSNMTISTIAGIPLIELRRTRLSGWGCIIKRITDILFGSLLLIICSPFYLLISIIILLETGRPVIYKNERIGQYNRRFFTYKFRTMFQNVSTGSQFGKSGAEALKLEQELIKSNNSKNGPIYKIQNDPRITKVGKFLRRWSLDELPQFWNVIRGEMSLVGPRPHQPREVEQYAENHSILLTIRPGVTGLAQISGRSNLTFEEEARLDTFYVENWNLYLDFIILIKTPFVVCHGKGAW